MSAKAKWEYLRAIHGRSRAAAREETQRILNEFCRVTTSHRKYAIRLLNGPAPGPARGARRRSPPYAPPVIDAVKTIWAAAGYPWSVRPESR